MSTTTDGAAAELPAVAAYIITVGTEPSTYLTPPLRTAEYPVERVRQMFLDSQHGALVDADILTAVPTPVVCEWFAACDRPAGDLEPHPVLGDVPICPRCQEKIARMQL